MRQIFGSFGSLFAAACCLGLAPLLSVLTAVGAGFLINDAILIPLFVFFLGFTLWSLHSSGKKHNHKIPFYIGLAGSILAFAILCIWTLASNVLTIRKHHPCFLPLP